MNRALLAGSVELDPDDGLQGLTSAQQSFARLVFAGLSSTEAYSRAFGIDASNPNVGKMAHRLLHDAGVNAKLVELRQKAEAQTSLAPLVNREAILQGIHGLALNGNKDSVRLAAYIALGKTREINLFGSEPIDKPKERSPEDIDRQLLDLIRGMRATIEGQAVDVTPAKEKPPAGTGGVAGRKRKPRA